MKLVIAFFTGSGIVFWMSHIADIVLSRFERSE